LSGKQLKAPTHGKDATKVYGNRRKSNGRAEATAVEWFGGELVQVKIAPSKKRRGGSHRSTESFSYQIS